MKSKRRIRPTAIEFLEARTLLTSVVVNTTADIASGMGSGTVSIVDAIATANASSTPTTITFDPTVFASAQSIDLTSPLELGNTGQATTITGPSATLTLLDDVSTGGAVIIDSSVTASVTGVRFSTATGQTDSSNITNSGSLTLANDEFDGGSVTRAIQNSGSVTLNQSVIKNHGDGNSGIALGGAIFNSGAVNIVNSTISNNDAGEGGAIYQAGGSLTITASTLSSNATDAGNGGTFSIGGGTVSLVDSTISGSVLNSDQNDSFNGCAIWMDSSTQVTLVNDTIDRSIYDNTDGSATAANIFVTSGATLTLGNTALASLQYADVSSPPAGNDVTGAVTSQGHNFIEVDNTSTGWLSSDLLGTTASPLASGLGALGSNGGPTSTEFPAAGSPLIDAGSNALIPNGITTDQRGDSRISHTTVDIGAVEVQNVVVTTITATAPANQTATVAVNQSFNLGSFTEANATGPYTVTVNWGDSSANTVFSASTAGTLATQSHTFATTGTKNVGVSITDSASHTSNTATFQVTVGTAAVTNITATPPANQTATVALSQAFNLGSFTATNATAPYTVTVNWGDSTANTVFAANTAGALTSQAHTFATAGVKNVGVTITDSASHTSNTATFQITATAAVPGATTITVTPGIAQTATVSVNKAISLGSFVASKATAPYSVSVVWGDGTANTTFAAAAAGTIASQAHTFATVGIKTVSVTVTDSASHASTVATFQVTVVSPTAATITVTPPANQTANIGQNVLFNLGSFETHNATGPFSATVNWGDGASTTLTNLAAGTIPAQTHAYTTSGDHTVTLLVTDPGGDASTSQHFTITTAAAGTAVGLAFTAQPSSANAGAVLAPVIVSIEDASGAVVATDNSTVTLSINGPAGAVLGGTLSVAAVNGVATFRNLSLTTAGGYTITASDSNDTTATSTAFAINTSALSAAIVRSTLPSALVGGQPTKGSVVVSLTNTSTTLTQSGLATLAVYASTDGVVDSSSILLSSIKHGLKLKPGKTSQVGIPVKLIPLSLVGPYKLVVEVTDPAGLFTQTAAGPTVNVAAPFITISAALGKVVRAENGCTLTVFNAGNVLDTTQVTYTVGFSFDAAGLQPIGQTGAGKTGTLHIKAGKSVNVHIPAWKKILGGLIYGNPYYLTIQITTINNGETASAVSSTDFLLS